MSIILLVNALNYFMAVVCGKESLKATSTLKSHVVIVFYPRPYGLLSMP